MTTDRTAAIAEARERVQDFYATGAPRAATQAACEILGALMCDHDPRPEAFAAIDAAFAAQAAEMREAQGGDLVGREEHDAHEATREDLAAQAEFEANLDDDDYFDGVQHSPRRRAAR